MIVDKTGNMKFWLAMAVCLLHFAANAAEVSSEDAVLAARGWAKSGAALGGAPSGETAGAKAYDGYFVVTFEGGGYVVMAADTDLKPVMSWSRDGEWIDDEAKNPVIAMMGDAFNAEAQGRGERGEDAGRNNAKWARYIAAGSAGAAPGGRKLLSATVTQVSETTDLRVDELLETRWNQGGVGSRYCYNFYTPNHSLCGCVATMAAQIMRHHRWPEGEVSFGKKNRLGADRWSYGYGADESHAQIKFSDDVWGYYEVWANELLDENGERWHNGFQINGYHANAEAVGERYKSNLTKWDPAFGGTYDWSKMPVVPSNSSTDEELREIGRLCRDVGLTVPIRYDGGGGSRTTATLALSLVDTFGYADAKFKANPTADDIRNGILANLDAKLPVGVVVPGHAIVADGYGYVDGDLYIHFNMGWGGGGPWVMPPVIYDGASIGGSNNKYDNIREILYNIYPEGEEGASIVSGRVLDRNGSPVEGVTVTARGARSCTTDSHGIYALFLQPGEHSISVVSGSEVARTHLAVAATSSAYIYKYGAVEEGKDGQYSSVGNVWGVDLVLEEASESELGWINETADTTGLTGEWSDGIAYDQTTRRAELSGENTFTPLPSGGNAASLEFTAKFDALTDDLTGMDSDAQMAFCIGANGKFRLWSGGAWVDVSAEGVTPASDVEYAVRVVFNYKSGCYSASVRDSGGTFRPLLDASGNGNFKISAEASHVGSVIMRGDCLFASLVGTYYTVSGFSPGDITGEDAQITLSEAHAAWLNALAEDRGYVTVSNGVARLSAARFETAYLCNLDVTREDFGATFGVTGIAVDDEKVAIEVTLERTGAVQNGGKDAPINGVLRFYGAATVEAFRSALSEKTPLADVTLSNGDFAGSETATAEIGRTPDSGDKFFKAGIGEK